MIEDNYIIPDYLFCGEVIELGKTLECITDYHANGSYEVLKEKAKLLDSPDFALMIRTTDLENNFSLKDKNMFQKKV